MTFWPSTGFIAEPHIHPPTLPELLGTWWYTKHRFEGKDMDEEIEVCQYCGNERYGRLSCCGEVHFVKMLRKDWEDGKELP